MTEYLPEGCLISSPENQDIINSEFLLKEACANGKILEAPKGYFSKGRGRENGRLFCATSQIITII